MSRRVLAVVVVVALLVPTLLAVRPPRKALAQGGGVAARKVEKSDAEWKKLLTGPQYQVTRHKATEPPFSGKYATSHAKGVFECVCCGAPLFSSQTKFDSGTGWPSFWRPIDPKSIDTAADRSTGESRVEVMCNDCGAHLGHVFDDGPPPTGLRYCINSLSLKLAPANPAREKATSRKGSPSRTKKASTPATDTPDDAPADKEQGK